jgi:hypothetical protein
MKPELILKIFQKELETIIIKGNKKFKEVNKKILQVLNTCKVFQISSEIFEPIAKKMEFESVLDQWNVNKAENELLEFNILQLRLPARQTLILWDGPQNIQSLTDIAAELVGLLITHEGLFTLMWVYVNNKKIPHIQITYFKDKWVPCIDDMEKNYEIGIIHAHQRMMEACIALSIINAISVVDIIGISKKKTEVVKYSPNLPEKYFKVRLREGIRDDAIEMDKIIKTIIRKGYSYFVRAHQKHRIDWGWLPIQPSIEEKLMRDPRRKIYKDINKIENEDMEYLQRRGLKLQPQMWVSILEFEVREHYARPDLPYVPSTHVIK